MSFTLVMPYYRNPIMLEFQVANWNSWSEEVRRQVNVVLVDDCSPEPAEPIFRKCTLKKALFRIDQDIPFNAHGARNLGMKMFGKDPDWALLTDMDVLIDEPNVKRLLAKQLSPGLHYTFEREFMDGRPRKTHCNTLLVTRGAFWDVKGYDEDYCGSYGGDGIFLRALEKKYPRQHLLDVVVTGFNNVIEDCSTRDLDRQGPLKDEYLRRRGEKKAKNDMVPRNHLRFPWHRVF